jgi:acetolactate synthase-1/2/3 large subunit
MKTDATLSSAWDQSRASEHLPNTPNGAEVILELLRTNGIDCIFASPIATMAPLWEALAARRERGEPEAPRYFHCRHEMLAVSAASGYYKATGRAQAVLLPTGFGVLHGAMALRTALQERTPMTVLSPDTLTYGEVPSLDPGPEWPSLLVDLVGPARQGELCVKWAKEARTAPDLVHELRRALYFAQAIPKGPTLLSVPFDLLMSPTPFEARPRIEPQPVLAAPAQLDEVAALLARSAEPILITEHGGRTEGEAAALLGVAEALAAPIFEFIMPAYHNAPRGHPLVMPGTVEPVLDRADAIVVAGSNAPWHPPNLALRPGCAVIHLEEDPLRPRAPYWGYRTTHAVAGDREANLRGLAERLRRLLPSPPQDRGDRWAAYKRQVLAQAAKDADAAQAQTEGAVPPAALFRALHRALPASSSIVDEIVSEITPMRQFLFESRPFRQYRGWSGALGTGLGTALGVKLARPGDTVVCVIGDGAFHYNPVPAALGFAQQYGVPLLIVVCDNRGYTSQTWNVHKYFSGGASVRSGQFFGDVLAPTPDYVKLAEAYGGSGERVESTAALGPAIERALAAVAAGRSALLDVFLTGVAEGKWQG